MLIVFTARRPCGENPRVRRDSEASGNGANVSPAQDRRRCKLLARVLRSSPPVLSHFRRSAQKPIPSAAPFVRVCVRSYYVKGHTYLAIVENHREENTTRQRVVLYLGRADAVDREALRKTIEGLRRAKAEEVPTVFTAWGWKGKRRGENRGIRLDGKEQSPSSHRDAAFEASLW